MLRLVTKNKKIILISLISLVALFVIVMPVLAVDLDVGIEYGTGTGLGTQDIRVTIAKIIRAALGLLGILAVAIVVYAGFLWMTSGGVPEKIDTAKKTLLSAAIGLVIILSAYAIASFVINALLEATGVVGEPCNECTTGETRSCPPDADLCSYIERCENTCWTGCKKVDPTCPFGGYYPFAQCPNPETDTNADNYNEPWLCLDPAAGGPLQTITILGGNIAANPSTKRLYFKDSSGNEFEVDPSLILSCRDEDWFVPYPNSDLKVITIKAPADLILDDPPGYKDYRVIAEFDSMSSENKLWGMTDPQDVYRLNTNEISTAPSLICILDGPDPFTDNEIYQASTGDERWIKFADFEPTVDLVTYNNEIATQGSYTTEVVQTTVPLTSSGNAYLNNFLGFPEGNSNPRWVDITCDPATADTDCLSGCCIPAGAQYLCSAESDCLGEVGEECFGGCFDAGCQAGLFCDTSLTPCTCQPRGIGSSCDDDELLAECQANDDLCGDPAVIYCSDVAGCTCQYLPVISDVKYPNGAPGNFVTIFGQGFGEDINDNTKVYFIDSGLVETEAPFPVECQSSDFWNDDQVVITIPNVAEGGYTIKLINVDNKEATWQTFTVNTTERPGLCSINPLFGSYYTGVRLLGKNFGSMADFQTDPDNHSVVIGGLEMGNKANWYWSQVSIGSTQDTWPTIPLLELPGNEQTPYEVQVVVGEENSNPLSFLVMPSPDLPVITRIEPPGDPGEPSKGPYGTYVTIIGENFGTDPGTVFFDNGEENKWLWTQAFIPPEYCTDYWQDDKVVIKVPSGTGMSIGNTEITLRTSADLWAANTMPFEVCANNPTSCPLRPGICGIIPDQAPINTGGIEIWGEYFGLEDLVGGNSKVLFPGAEADFVNWAAGGISGVTVPIDAQTGDVKIVRGDDGIVSNGYPFTVGDCRLDREMCVAPEICCEKDGICQLPEECEAPAAEVTECTYGWSFTTGTLSDQLGPPQVIQYDICEGNTQSPSPQNNSESNCVNALVSARFNQPINTLTLSEATIILQACNLEDPADPGFKSADCSGAITSTNIDYIPDDDNNAIGFIYYPDVPDALLDADRWYQVTLESGAAGIKSLRGIWLDGDYDNRPGGNFSWFFKVQDSIEECTIEKVILSPKEATLDIEGDYQDYLAIGIGPYCNILNGATYDWDWYKEYSDGQIEDALADDVRGTAFISEDDLDPADGRIDYKQVATPNPPNQGLVYVVAEPELAAEEAKGKSRLIVDLNTPVIDYIHPDNGLFHPDVNAYVTVYGYNFGDSPKDSQVLFDDVPAQLADCPNSWTDTMIQVVVPKGVQAEAQTLPLIDESLSFIPEFAQIFYDFEEESKVLAEDRFNQADAEMIDGFKENERFGQAIYLNGSSSYVNILNPENFNFEQGSIELWFKSYDIIEGQSQTIFSFSDKTEQNIFLLEIISSDGETGKIRITENIAGSPAINNVTVVPVLKQNTWHHLVYTYDSEKYLIYVDGRKFYYVTNGNLDSTNTSPTGFLADFAQTSILLGAKNNGAYLDFFNGVIDNFTLYDRVLTEEEVRSRIGLNNGQVLLLNFDGIGGQITDSSPNSFSGLAIEDPTISFRINEGVYGRAINFENNNSIIITDNPTSVYQKEVTIETWVKIPQIWFNIHAIDATLVNKIYESSLLNLGIMDCNADGTTGLCFQVYLADEDNETGTVFYNEIAVDNLTADQWNYIAAVFDGQALNLYVNGNKSEYADPAMAGRRIMQKGNFGYASIGNNEFIGSLDQFALYTQALTEEVISSRTGAKDGSHVIVQTPFGEAISEQTFNYSTNVYPFLCSLNPYYGVENTQVSATGDNFGDSNITTFQGREFKVNSYVNLDLITDLRLLDQEIKKWLNISVDYLNPIRIEDFAAGTGEPKFDVFVTIDPYSDPFIDVDGDGIYTPCDPEDLDAVPGIDCDDFADLEYDGYDSGDYNIGKTCDNDPSISCQSDGDCAGGTCVDVIVDSLASNTLPFYLPPYLHSLSPDNGPIEQWVTIIGQNFGTEPGQVYFYNGQVAQLAPCNISWTDNFIIAVVPPGAESGDVYVVTVNGIESVNRLPFEVNTKPLGAGLCEVYNLQPYIENKEAIDSGEVEFIGENIGRGLEYVRAEGDRFGDEQGDSNLIFYSNVTTLIGTPTELEPAEPWSDQLIMGQINPAAQTGLVVVNRKIETGRQCVGFSIGSWCPGGEEVIYEEVPSNAYPFTIIDICEEGVINTWKAKDEGFPIQVWVYDAGGEKQNYDKINTTLSTTDGTYMYTMAQRHTDYRGREDGLPYGNYYVRLADHEYPDLAGDESYGIPDEDNARTIWKIGTGYNGTELGRVYAKYDYDYRYNTPEVFRVNPSSNYGWGFGYFSFISTSDGSIYVPEQHYHQDTNVNPTNWRVSKVQFNNDEVFDETERIYHGSWSINWVSIPQGIINYNFANLPEIWAQRTSPALTGGIAASSNGNLIFATAYDAIAPPTDDRQAYTIQVMSSDWQELKRFEVKPAEHESLWYAYTIRTGAISIADEQYLYKRYNAAWQLIDWHKQDWASYWSTCAGYTQEYSGFYDYYHNKYWFGNWTNETSTANLPTAWWSYNCNLNMPEPAPRNRIYRYSACEFGERGFCRSDEDCQRGALNCQSQCIDGFCTPWIKEFTPTSGPIGTWVTLNGCWFGCEPGQINFKSTKSNITNPPLSGNIARYYFDTGAEDATGNYDGILNDNAYVDNGELVLDGTSDGVRLTNTGLNNPNLYGGYENGRLTFAAWIYPTREDSSKHITIARRIGPLHYFTINPNTKQLQILIKHITSAGTVGNSYPVSGVSGTIPVNQWTHVAVVVKAGKNGSVEFYINGALTKRTFSEFVFYNWATDSGIGLRLNNSHAEFPGRIDDVYIYNKALTGIEIARLAGSKPGLVLTDPECGSTWQCSPDGYDQVIIEVPNKNILPNEENADPDNDAVDGSISLTTARGWTTSTKNLSPGIFDVNDEPPGPQICNLIPDTGKRGDTIRIHGENLGDPVAGDYVYFGFGSLYEPQEPWFDQLDEVYDFGEDFVDFDEDETWDAVPPDGDLDADTYTFNLDTFYSDKADCPAGGWSDADICIKVPKDTSNILSDCGCSDPMYTTEADCLAEGKIWQPCSDAAGQGTYTGIALDNIKLFKDFQEYGSLTFKTLFGYCGDNMLDADTDEDCDGDDIQVTEEDRIAACLALFPGECSVDPVNNTNETDCQADGGIWTANDLADVTANCTPLCDSNCDLQFCYNGVCLYLDELCGNGTMESFPSANYEEECDCGNQSISCDWPAEECPEPAQGSVSCSGCEYDYSDCLVGLPEPLKVTGHIPYHGEEAFCRNAIIDIYFDQLVNPGTIGYMLDDVVYRNIRLWKCDHPSLTNISQSSNKSLVRRVIDYFKNIFSKLIGSDRRAYAQFECTAADWELVPYENYYFNYRNVNGKALVSIYHNGHLDPAREYAVEILGGAEGIRSSLGGVLDNYNSPIVPPDQGLGINDYAFMFKTLGALDPVSLELDPQSGICDVEWIDTVVYRQEYTGTALANRPSEYRNDDLFVCAGADDCQLEIDYDQIPLILGSEKFTSGNQHIYKAIAKHSSGFSLKATYQWSKNSVLDPYNVLNIHNNFQYCEQGDAALVNQECWDNLDCETAGQCSAVCIASDDLSKLGDACEIDDDCGLNGDCDEANLICVSGDTAKLDNSCVTATDCETEGLCVARSICSAGENIGISCTDDSECGTGGLCSLIGDITSDPDIVKNETGVVITTALPIKEAVAQLAIEAQAEGSFAPPAQEVMTVYVILCKNPWPSFDEKFPISSLINAYNFELYYCRDAGLPDDTTDDLPAATWLFPEVTSLSVLYNTDFESGNLNDWVVLEGNAFDDQPVYSDINRIRNGIPSLIQGNWWLSTKENYQGYDWQDVMDLGPGNTPVGVLQSQAFLIEGDTLKFKIAGGNNAWPGSVTQIVALDSGFIDYVTAVVLAVKDDPSPEVDFEVIATATGDESLTLAEKQFDTSLFMTGRSCEDDLDCNDWGSCKDMENSVCGDIPDEPCQCSPVTGIIYIYDNNTADYISFDDLKQFKGDLEIPIRF